jgi:hypothetical protein
MLIDAKCYRSVLLLLCVCAITLAVLISDGTCPRGLATRLFLSFSVCARLSGYVLGAEMPCSGPGCRHPKYIKYRFQ